MLTRKVHVHCILYNSHKAHFRNVSQPYSSENNDTLIVALPQQHQQGQTILYYLSKRPADVTSFILMWVNVISHNRLILQITNYTIPNITTPGHLFDDLPGQLTHTSISIIFQITKCYYTFG